jgi:hypothetical protein
LPRYCDLETGAAIFYEQFEGAEGLKDRYFIVIQNNSPIVECLTTTTQPHALTRPKLATEFCDITDGECCLPKRCFIDFRQIYTFDDIALGSRLRSKSVKFIGDLTEDVLRKIRAGLAGCRTLTPLEKERLLAAIDAALEQ